MTRPSETSEYVYDGDGVSVDFDFNQPVVLESDLTVVLIDEDTGDETVQVLNTDYTVALAANSATVTMLAAPASTEKLLLLRTPDNVQPTNHVDNDPFDAATANGTYDKRSDIDQYLYWLVNRALRRQGYYGDNYDATADRVVNAADAIDGTDLVTLQQVQALFDALDDAENMVVPVMALLTGDNSTTTFVLGTTDEWPSTNALLYTVVVGGVPQRPNTDFTLGSQSGNRIIIFATAPPVTSANCIFVICNGWAGEVAENFSARERIVTLVSSGGVLTIDLSLGNMFQLTLTENITSVVFTNPPTGSDGQGFNIAITQHASAAKTITGWPAGVKWFTGTYAVSTTVGAQDEVGLSYFSSTKILGKYAKGAA